MHVSRILLAFVTTGAAAILTLAPTRDVVAELPSLYHQRVRVHDRLPNYDYGHDSSRFSASALAVADAVQAVTWHDERMDGPEDQTCWQQISPPLPLEFYVPRAADARNMLGRPVQRKPFHFTQASLTVNHIKLDQVGLSIYDTGHIAASGKVSHNGGADGGLAGNNVTIRLRAYAAPVNQIGQLPINSTLLWQSEQRLWVKRGPSQVISLTSQRNLRDPDVRRYFNEITHLEVELEYGQDR